MSKLIALQNGQIGNPILPGDLGTIQFAGGTGLTYFTLMISNLITLSLVIGTVVALFKLILGAIHWISSGGDKAGLEGAQKEISNAIIGLFILFGIFAFFKLIELVFGIKVLSIDLAPLFIK